jgi:hypothetical protein
VARLVGCMNFVIFLLLVYVMPVVGIGVLIALSLKGWRQRRKP